MRDAVRETGRWRTWQGNDLRVPSRRQWMGRSSSLLCRRRSDRVESRSLGRLCCNANSLRGTFSGLFFTQQICEIREKLSLVLMMSLV